jgi:hypothetical protein
MKHTSMAGTFSLGGRRGICGRNTASLGRARLAGRSQRRSRVSRGSECRLCCSGRSTIARREHVGRLRCYVGSRRGGVTTAGASGAARRTVEAGINARISCHAVSSVSAAYGAFGHAFIVAGCFG